MGDDNVIKCANCPAPAHGDCWEYVVDYDTKGPRRYFCRRCYRIKHKRARKRP